MEPATDQPSLIRNRGLNALILPLVSVVVLWCIWLIDEGFGLGLTRFGLIPRNVHGLIGIITAPLLHDGLDHVLNNSSAVVVLGWCLMYFYPRIAGRVVLLTWLIGGAAVWLMGRENVHVGASGVVYGMAAFLFVSGVLRRQRTLMALSLLVAFMYGSMVWGIFPLVPRVSWESHLWGGIIGIVLAFVHRHVPPAVNDPRPAFADEEDEEDAIPMIEADEVNDAGLEWQRKPAEDTDRNRPGNVSTTWDQ
ncbi:MAG: rhomboid family intramembrane serine protease [Flavobacteriales bacterium]|nr:rhomboid family intramembrane serine protease [Flavobacteriales bacterium]